MIYFRAEGVVNYDTLVYGVVRSEIGPTLEDGVAINHPIEQVWFSSKGLFKAPPLLRTIAMVYHPSK